MNRQRAKMLTIAAALAVTAVVCRAQQQSPAGTSPKPGAAEQASPASSITQTTTDSKGAASTGNQTKPVKQPTGSERRRAAKLFLDASKLYETGQFERAFVDYQQAASLDPTNQNYALAAGVARSHAVTALMQTAAQARTKGDAAGTRGALARARDLDPTNPQIAQHFAELGDDAAAGQTKPFNEQATSDLTGFTDLDASHDRFSFHLHTTQREIIQKVFKQYGIDATLDETIRGNIVRLDLDDATFAEASHAVSLLSNSFFEPIDAHRVLVALDTQENRLHYTRDGVETVYLAGLTPTEMTDIGNLAKNVFEVLQSNVDPTAGTITLKAPERKLNAFNATFESLMAGKSQVLLDVRLIQLAHTRSRNTGVTPPQQVTAFNVYAEEQSILNANQDLVQQIISSGLAAPGDTLAILGILLASGQVSSSLFSNGLALFGGGITQSALSPGPAKVNLSLNSSDSRELDEYQLHLGDGEEGTLRNGSRYPIMTSSFSSAGASALNIPGLTSAGNSSSLSSILSSLGGAGASIPQIQYEDLGLTLKATPRVMRSGDVALTIDLKISALAGTAVNDVPVLANRAWSGVVTVPANQAVVVASEMDRQESRAVGGMPGLSEIPGLNNITGKDVETNNSTLLIVMTPHVIRSPRTGDHTPMIRIDRKLFAR
jgi:general secretion pathway protein D